MLSESFYESWGWNRARGSEQSVMAVCTSPLVSSGHPCPCCASPEDTRWLQKPHLCGDLRVISINREIGKLLLKRKINKSCWLRWCDAVHQLHPSHGTWCGCGWGSPRRCYCLSFYRLQLDVLMQSLEAVTVWIFLWSGAVKLEAKKWDEKGGGEETMWNVLLAFICSKAPVCVCRLNLLEMPLSQRPFAAGTVSGWCWYKQEF